MFCANCGRELTDSANYCKFCGEKAIISNRMDGLLESDIGKQSESKYRMTAESEYEKSDYISKTVVFPPDLITLNRMRIFALISMVFTVFSSLFSGLLRYLLIQNYFAMDSEGNFFELNLSNGLYIDNLGKLFVEVGINVIFFLFFMIVCINSDKIKPSITAFPIVFVSLFTFLWKIVLLIVSKMGLVHIDDANFILESVLCFVTEILFVIVYLLSVKGSIHSSLLAKFLIFVFGCISETVSFIFLINKLVSASNSTAIGLVTFFTFISLLSYILMFLAFFLSKIAMFVYVFNVRRNNPK